MEDTIEKIHKAYDALLYRVAFSYVKNKSDAEDAVQEVYIKLLKKKPVFVSENHQRAWLLRVLNNICKDIQKNTWNCRTVGLDKIPEKERALLRMPFGIEDDTLWNVMSLVEKYRLPLYLFYYEGYAIREIAEILDIPESTVKTHLKRGREEVRKQLEKK